MSITVIRAETDQLRSVAGQMRQVADQIGGGADGMNQAMEALGAVWNGQAADRGKHRWTEIYPKYRPDSERLLHFAGELEALATRLDEAAAVFGDNLGAVGGTGDGATTTSHDDYGEELPTEVGDVPIQQLTEENMPQNMAELFDLIPHNADGSGNDEIAVYRLQNGEYVIGLKGTAPLDWNDLDSGTNAVGGAFDETSYSHKLRDVLGGLPDDASVHLAGYSQGGMVAQRIAADSTIFGEGKLHLASLSTFGSPDMGWNIQADRIYDFDAPGDIVSALPVLNNMITPESLLAVSSSLLAVSSAMVVGVLPGVLPTAIYGVVAHMQGYQNDNMPEFLSARDEMTATATPWATEIPDPDNHTLPEIIGDGYGYVAEKTSDGLNYAIDKTGEGLENVKNFVEDGAEFVGNTVEEVTSNIPKPLRFWEW